MKVQPLSKTYGDRTVLDLPEFELMPGQICAVIGANGSGKSTLAKLLSGILSPDQGFTPFENRPDIGYMPQTSFAFRMSAEKNLALTGANSEEVHGMLDRLQLSHLSSHSAKRFSGGELTRLALGRVLIRPHELLILDEPTAAMDMESTLLAEQLITAYCREHNAAVLLVTHSLAQARRMADTVLFLHHGIAVEQGDAKQVLNCPQQEETRRFLEFYGT